MEANLHRKLGLTDEEYSNIVAKLGREPNNLELAMYSVMWSEHCSYKSSKIYLKKLPTHSSRVLVGPGENAGVVDLGNNYLAALRIESHNHPSAIEPHQGAATGVGGIIRDIFAMGARPIALMDALFTAPLNNKLAQWHLEGIVSGISAYGNSVGVPTIGGEITFESCYLRNPLVNVFCLGMMRKEHLVLARAKSVGSLVILAGSSTGRDGIGGVSILASEEFSAGDKSREKLPSVQVGDPFEEKRLIEATLELYSSNIVDGIQDLGGAGLTCAASEISSRSNLGMELYLDRVPLRETGMNPVEIMTSESQERMLIIVSPNKASRVEEICNKWEINCSIIGKVTEGQSVVIKDREGGNILGCVPAKSLADEGPVYNRPVSAPITTCDKVLLSKPDLTYFIKSNLISADWIFSQYDHELFLNSPFPPGEDFALLKARIPEEHDYAQLLSVSLDSNPVWVLHDPTQGSIATVIESITNVILAGAEPIAIVNCINLGNPENPKVMGQLAGITDGLKRACEELSVPIVGGNVSFYNSVDGKDIYPTLVLGTLGLLENKQSFCKRSGPSKGDFLYLVSNGLSQSELIPNDLSGSLCINSCSASLFDPKLKDFKNALPKFIKLCRNNKIGITDLHDVSRGGLATAIAEMLTKKDPILGANIETSLSFEELCCELPGRFIASVMKDLAQDFEAFASQLDINILRLGLVTDGMVEFAGFEPISSKELRQAFVDSIAGYFNV